MDATSHDKVPHEVAESDLGDLATSKVVQEAREKANNWEPTDGDDKRNKAMRYNAGKPQLSYPLSTGVALEGVARVMEFGAQKYARDNWKEGLDPTSVLDSMLRHITAYLDGEYIDPDSGLPHVDHIACNALFLGYHTDRETGDNGD